MLEPFEKENLIFIDTEYTSLDPKVGEVMSIGIVKLSGEELYLEVEYSDHGLSDWVKENILNTLTNEKLAIPEAIKKIQDFIGDTNPFAIAFVDNYDVIYLTKLFGHGNLPFRWMTIDFTSILFAIGVNPVKFQSDTSGATSYYRKLGIDLKKYRKHHALDDAKLLRDVWMKLTERVE